MKATAEWDAKKYQFGQRAELTLTVTNDSRYPILVRGSTVNFRRTNKKLKESHSIPIDPNASKVVKKFVVTVGPWAEQAGATGTLTITYEAKKGTSWECPKPKTFSQDDALSIDDVSPTGQKIFISHSNSQRDGPILEEVERIAKKAGLEPYVSEKDPNLGDNLWKKILEQVRVCDGFIILLTKDGGRSCDMREELGYARMRNAVNDGTVAKIVPIVERGVDPAGSLKGEEYKEIDVGKPRLVANQIAEIIIDSFVKRTDET